jgi:hypothetical protein
LFVGKPYEAKVSRTVWSRGKAGDYFKGLPMAIQPSTDGQPTALNNVWQLRVARFEGAVQRGKLSHDALSRS